jgi:hypothetical protein
LEELVIIIVMGLIIVAGAALMATAMTNRRKMREMAYRERIAMIERGLVPSPEQNPGRFESSLGFAARSESRGAARFRTAGVVMIGLGLGLMLLITFAAGEPGVGFGVGGAWAALGGALLLNYFLMSRREQHDAIGLPAAWAPPPSQPVEPPSNVGP